MEKEELGLQVMLQVTPVTGGHLFLISSQHEFPLPLRRPPDFLLLSVFQVDS